MTNPFSIKLRKRPWQKLRATTGSQYWITFKGHAEPHKNIVQLQGACVEEKEVPNSRLIRYQIQSQTHVYDIFFLHQEPGALLKSVVEHASVSHRVVRSSDHLQQICDVCNPEYAVENIRIIAANTKRTIILLESH